MSEDKHLTWEQVVEGLYGFKPKKRAYSEEELARYRSGWRNTPGESGTTHRQKSESGPKDT